MIIDTEAHIFYRVAPRECSEKWSMLSRASWHEYSGELYVAEMDQAGVDLAFLNSYDADDLDWYFHLIGSEPDASNVFGGRKYTLESGVKRYPDRFLWFNTLKHVHRSDAITRLRRDLSDGAVGMKIFPAHMNLRADDPDLMEAYKVIADAGRRVIFSFEETLPPQTPTVCEYFEQLDRVLTELPDLKVQVNHAGAGNPADPASDPLNPEAKAIFNVVNAHDNVWLSTAYLAKSWDDEHEYPYARYLSRLEALKEAVGVERLFWASDWPWLERYQTYPQAVDTIRRHASFLSTSEKELFLGQNAYDWVKDLLPNYHAAPIFQTP